MISTCLPIGIIADDLTGACDTGVQFAKRGLHSTVWFDVDAIDKDAADVVILSSDSRADDAQTAMGKVDYLAQRLQSKGISLLYKKIDSTLRGQVGAEIESAMHAAQYKLAIVTPAFPVMGRTVVNGWLQISGPDSPKPLHLPTHLAEQSELSVVHLPMGELQTIDLPSQINRLQHDEPTIMTLDAVTNEHLAMIAEAALAAPFPVLIAGSGGLGDAVAAQLADHFGRSQPEKPELDSQGAKHPVALFIGSNAIATQRQVEQLLETESVSKFRLGIDKPTVLQDSLRQGNHLLISLRWNDTNNRENLLPCLALLQESEIAGMIISGGDTARLVCDVAGVTGIQLEDELLPGLPWGRMIGGAWNGLPICTKSGRFGEDDAFVKVVQHISRISHL